MAYTSLQIDLARQIVEHVAHQQLAVGTRLTELSLVQRLGVSRTPIRAALALLAERGVLAPHPSRGLVVALPAEALARLNFERRDDTALYERMLQDRVEGRLPARLSERDLLERYAVRRGTLNLTLARLQQEGVLRRRRGRGWEFEQALDSLDSERESYRFRLILECAALLEPGFRCDPRQLAACRTRQAALLANPKRRTWAEIFDANAQFHELLAASSGNRFILKAVQEQNRLRRQSDLADYPRIKAERLRQSCADHLAILDAIERGDQTRAAALMRAHLLSATDTVEQRAAGQL